MKNSHSRLGYVIRFYVGTEYDSEKRPITRNMRDDRMGESHMAVCERYNGFTAYNGYGAWTGPDGSVVCEDCVIFEVLADNDDNAEYAADALRTIWSQSEVWVTVTPTTRTVVHDR